MELAELAVELAELAMEPANLRTCEPANLRTGSGTCELAVELALDREPRLIKNVLKDTQF